MENDHISLHKRPEPKRIGQSRENQEKLTKSYSLFHRVGSSNLPGTVIVPCACIVLLSEASSSSHVCLSIQCVSTRFCSPDLIFEPGDSINQGNLKIFIFPNLLNFCAWITLMHIELSHMDFPGHRTGFHWWRMIISRCTQSPSPNELVNPKSLMKNWPKRIYSFTGFEAPIFPAE